MSSPSIRGCGRLTGAFLSDRLGVLAVASEFERLRHEAGRGAFSGQALLHRLTLHRPGEATPFAWFDDLTLPINSVAFHPSRPVVAIGAGIHDGGYAFNGDLVLWNWVDGTVLRPFARLPEVVHLAFDQAGALDLLFRRWDEGWGQWSGQDDDIFLYPLRLEADQFETGLDKPALDPEVFVALSDPEAYDPNFYRTQAVISAHLALDTLVAPRPVLDIGWFGDAVGWVTGERVVDLHDVETGERRAIDAPSLGYGVAIVQADRPLVQTMGFAPGGAPERETRLLAIADDRLAEVSCWRGVFNLVGSDTGRILGRHLRQPGEPGRDFVADRAGRLRHLDLAAYVPHRHHLGVSGAPALYVLQADPLDPRGMMQVWRVISEDEVEPLWPLLPSQEGPGEAHECCGLRIDDEAGESLVIAGVHAPRRAERGFLYRRRLDGAELWRTPTNAAATSLAWLPRRNLLVAAFLDGQLQVIEAATGRPRAQGRATVQGAPAVIYALAARDDGRLALGVQDGQVLVTQVDDVRESKGLIELAVAGAPATSPQHRAR